MSSTSFPRPVPALVVDLGARSYPIYIGSGTLGDPALLASHVGGRQVLVVTDTNVGPLYLDAVLGAFGELEAHSLVLPAGEAHKTLATLARVFDRLVELRFTRRATVVALGGGVVGDLAGFAAACYQRGIAYLQVPTTLLAQVDSSVGGKTAVNHPGGKNMIGAFHQPAAVVADMATLDTLSDRELRGGLAEVIKYGVVWDRDFFAWLETSADALLARSGAALAAAVRRCCEIKAEVVAADERESNLRALLNLGHTFGHAIETGLGHGTWLHGEAVAAGICMAADTAVRTGSLAPGERARVAGLVARVGLPTGAPRELAPARMLELMAVDKKAVDGALRLVLPSAIGRASVTAGFDPAALRATLEQCRQ